VTTPLERPLSREVIVGGEPYRVVISPEGVRITPKGHRLGTEATWESVLALSKPPEIRRLADRQVTDVPEAIAADVAREVRKASDALTRAGAALGRAGTFPAEVLVGVEPDPVYGRREHRDDWFVEPLLTPEEVASILRLTPRAVTRLPLRRTLVNGTPRYRQSELRQYLASQDERPFGR
jgi:hypothetical protein